MSEPLDAAMDVAADPALEPDHALSREETVRTAVSRFLELAPAQRSCVILKDVLEYSLEEIATMLDMSVPAIKAALHRGRSRFGTSPPRRSNVAPNVPRPLPLRVTPRYSTRGIGTACAPCWSTT